MTAIYICDDELIILQAIAEKIERKLIIENYDMRIMGTFTKAEALLETIKQGPRKNIYFLDVELKEDAYDGFLLGKAIRNIDPTGILVYITSFQDLAYKTFQYHLEAFDYIVKDVDQLDTSIDHCLQEIEQKLCVEGTNTSTDMLSIKVGEALRHLHLEDIDFFETSTKPHHVIVHTKQGRIDFAGNLNELEEQVGSRFMRIHRSYLVSLDKIQEVNLKQNYVCIGKQTCLVSRKAKSKLLAYLNRR